MPTTLLRPRVGVDRLFPLRHIQSFAPPCPRPPYPYYLRFRRSVRTGAEAGGSSAISGCLSSSYPAFPPPVRHMLCRPVRGSVSIRRWMLCGGPILQAPPPTTASTFSSYPRCVFGNFLDSNSSSAMCISLCIGVLHRSPPPLIDMTSLFFFCSPSLSSLPVASQPPVASGCLGPRVNPAD